MSARLVKLGTLTREVRPEELGISELPYVGIIGGSGLYDPGIFRDTLEVQLQTPYGTPSDNVLIGRVGDRWVAFLARHGRGHRYPPHAIPYRANIWSLRMLGVKVVISVSAVGSLRLDYRPGDFVVPHQFIDMTKRREHTFYEGPGACHVQIGLEPFTEELRQLLIEESRKLNVTHDKGVYICIEGPRFSTLAESRVWREAYGADIIGMTLVPEVVLARELGMCYAALTVITDYDVLVPERPVVAHDVIKLLSEKMEIVKKVVVNVIPRVPGDLHKKCEKVLESACI